MKEKLIELLEDAPMDYEGNRNVGVIADHLIANGVTFGKDNNVPGKWIPVTERFPEKCVDYLCLCVLTDDNHVKPFCMVLRYIRDNEPHFQYELNGNIKVTHWMPLPEPPKEDI